MDEEARVKPVTVTGCVQSIAICKYFRLCLHHHHCLCLVSFSHNMDDADLSDLTDYEYEDGSEEGGEYKLKNALNVPRATTYPAEWLRSAYLHHNSRFTVLRAF